MIAQYDDSGYGYLRAFKKAVYGLVAEQEKQAPGTTSGPNTLPGHPFGWFNNLVQGCRMLIGKESWGCINQANYVYTALTNSKFQAAWDFSKDRKEIPPHSRVKAETQPSVPCPTTVTIDPWADEFEVH